MVIETGIVVGYLIAWAARRARRAAPLVDAVVDDAVEAGLEALHRAVVEKLGSDPAVVALDRQSGADGRGGRPPGPQATPGEVSERTRMRVKLALDEAIEADQAFAGTLVRLLDRLRVAEQRADALAGGQQVTGQGVVTVAGRDASVVVGDRYTAGRDLTIQRP